MSYKIPEYFTHEQKLAVEFEGNNVLVSAAAGCGKTTLMIERIIRKVLNDKVNINEIIVVTFTEAAAAELKQRLEISLNKNIENDREFIQHQLSILNDAYISTFHSLCTRLLKENGVMFNFNDTIKIGEGLQIKNLKLKAFTILDQECINDEDYQKLREYYCSLVDCTNLFNLITNALEVCITKDSITGFTNQALNFEKPTSIFDYPDFADLHIEATNISLSSIIQLFKASISENNNAKTAELIEENITLFSEIQELASNKNYQAIHEKIKDFKMFTKPRASSSSHEEIRNNHESIKEEINKRLLPLYSLANDEYLYIIETNNHNTKTLLKYTKRYHEILNQLKNESGILEFNDLEQETLKLLYDGANESATALKLKNIFNEIMIDEYQDTNLIQERIVNALANGKNTFMVGDLKQAIYRFRNATPELFTQKYELYQNNKDGIVIDLSFNFRSKNEVLETTNYIFKSTFSKNIGGIDYDMKNQLYFKNEKLNEEIGNFNTKLFYNIFSKEDDLKKDDFYLNSSKSIVNEIKKLINEGRNYRDIAILFRGRSNSKILTNLLDKEDIPYMIHDNAGFYASYEIKDLLNLLKALTNPYNDIALIGALRSYFFNFDESDLLDLALCDGVTYYQKLCKSKYTKELMLLNDLINYTKQHLPLDIINYIFSNTPYLDYIANHSNYEQFLMNVNTFKKIINENLDYYNSLEYLISELDYSISTNFDTARPATLSEKEDVVNIMTIHKSKGLEFKYVFLFDEAKIKFDTIQKSIDVKTYKKNIVLRFIDSKQKIVASNPLNNLINFANKKEILAEELRVLYVALTRAKLQLYIFTNIKDERLNKLKNSLKNESNWLIDESIILDTKKLLEPVILSFLRHKNGINLRESSIINSNEEIYKFQNNLFDANEYDYSLLNINYNKDNNKVSYPIRKVEKRSETQITIEKFVPSKHSTDKLDFANIKTFDTFKQGTIAHKVLELLDFNSNNINNDLNKLLVKFPLHNKNYEGIKAFINSNYFNIFKNSTIHKEYTFTTLSNNNIITGIIDLYVETQDKIYIVDYKSDNLSLDELKKQYSKQLKIYYETIKKTTNKTITCLIYSLNNQEFIEI